MRHSWPCRFLTASSMVSNAAPSHNEGGKTMIRQPLLISGLTLALVSSTPAAWSSKPAAQWVNSTEVPDTITVSAPPQQPILLQTAANGRPFRILPTTLVAGKIRLSLPPHSTAEMWNRPDLAKEMTPFGTAARWGALPHIAIGPTYPDPGDEDAEIAPWSSSSGSFRAYPNADLSVTVSVRNDGLGLWTHPRVELMAPDNWTVTPKVADVLSMQKKAASPDAPSISAGQSGVLPPTVTGVARFTVRIPESARADMSWPLIAFLRFNTVGETLTVQNSVDVRVEQPVALSFGMNEAGTKFVTAIRNRFVPAALGKASVHVSSPDGAAWANTQPEAVEVESRANAVAEIGSPASHGESLRPPVSVSVAGSVVHGTPVIYAVAVYAGPSAREDGVRVVSGGVEHSDSGLAFAGLGRERMLTFDVARDFAVADPTTFVSPTWISVSMENRGATRARLEYDAFGTSTPSVAADVPIAISNGPVALSFLLPDARFAGTLPGGGDFTLVLNGDATLSQVTVSKWNPAPKP